MASSELFEDLPSWAGIMAFVGSAWDWLLLGFLGDDLAGFCTVHALPRPDAVRQGFIYELGVIPAFQRKGVGRALIGFAREECTRRGVRGLWVITNRSNKAACSLYLACGGFAAAADDVVYEWP